MPRCFCAFLAVVGLILTASSGNSETVNFRASPHGASFSAESRGGHTSGQAGDITTRIDRMVNLLARMDALFASIDARKQAISARAPHRFQFTYTFEPKGERYWSQVSSTEWLEKYETGEQSRFRIVQRAMVADDQGVIAAKADGALSVFIPDKGSSQMWVRFRAAGTQEWNFLGEMTHIE